METALNREYRVKWKNHLNHKLTEFSNLFDQNNLIDITLYCEGQKIGAHKVILSACSLFFRDCFQEMSAQQILHPFVVIYGMKQEVLQEILRFIYTGEVSVETDKLDEFLSAAKQLRICGLIDQNSQDYDNDNDETQILPSTNPEDNAPLASKRIKLDTVDQHNNETIISHVKVEPCELVDFEDPLADPLQEESKPSRSTLMPVGESKLEKEELNIKPPVIKGFSEESLICPECNKRFSHPYSLQHHKAVHAGSTQCTICNAVLSRKYNLKMHMKARHNT